MAALRVGIISKGTRGDVQPFLALSLELQKRGHQVAICCPACCVEVVQEYGLEAFRMSFDPKRAIQCKEMQLAIAEGDGASCVRAFNTAQEQQIEESGINPADEVYDFVQGFQPDVIVGHPSFVPLMMVAEAMSVPLINALFMPFLPSAVAQPVFFSAKQLERDGFLERPLEAHRLFWDMYISPEEFQQLQLLRKRWGLRPYKDVMEVQAAYQACPEANCWSSRVIPEPADLAPEFPLARQTGYLFADAPSSYTPPAELVTFLEAKAKPLYIGFGSLCVGDSRLATEKVIRALMRAKGELRCVMAGGWAGLSPASLDESLEDFVKLKKFAEQHVFHLSAVPHDWLLPFCCGAVHHGGAGTVAACCRAGIPQAVLPVAWDQPWWAEHLEQMGLGINLHDMISQVDEDSLCVAFERLAFDPQLAATAAALGTQIEGERHQGQLQLADFVEQCLDMPHPWATAACPATTPQPPLWCRKSVELEVQKSISLGGA